MRTQASMSEVDSRQSMLRAVSTGDGWAKERGTWKPPLFTTAEGLHLSSTGKEVRLGSIWNELGTLGRKFGKFRKLSQISLYF